MKDMHESFDDELKNRLQNYSEDPDAGLWANIAAKIPTKPDPLWIKWSDGIGLVLIVLFIGASLFNAGEKKQMTSSLSESTQKGIDVDHLNEISEESVSTEAHNETVDVNDKASSVNEIEKVNENANRSNQNQSVKEGINNSKSLTDKVSADRNFIELNDSKRSNKKEANLNRYRQKEIPVTMVFSKRNLLKNITESIRSENEVKVDDVFALESADENREQQNVNRIIEMSKPIMGNNQIDDQNKKQIEILTPGQKENSVVTSQPDNKIDSVAKNVAVEKINKKSNQQNEEKKINKDHKYALYLLAMPTFGYQRIEANTKDNILIDNVKKVSNFSTKRLGIRAEVGIIVPVSKRLSLAGGILYYQRKQTIDYVEKIWDSTYVENTSASDITLAPHFKYENKTFEYELKNVGVQLGFNYILSKGKFLHTAGTGIEFHKALNKFGEKQKQEGFSANPSTYVFYNVFYRVQYPAVGKIKAIFQPTFNYSLFLNENMNAPFYVKPYGFGLNFGITYNF
jgi:hypothetical protein